MDAFILSEIMDYKVSNDKCGFPDNSINKIINELSDKKISFQIIYHDKDPQIHDFRNINTYQEYYESSIIKVKIRDKIAILNETITKGTNSELKEILEVMNEHF